MTPQHLPAPIRHDGPCGRRARCYRADCREQWGDVPTVEVVAGRVVAYCHRLIVPADPVTLRRIAA